MEDIETKWDECQNFNYVYLYLLRE